MPAMRDYTPRRYDLDTLELDIDFVLHGDGPASTWAEQAKPGQFLHIGGPRGSMIVPDMFDSYLLIGDETALPAIARRLESLAANRKALVVIEVENGAEQQVLESAAQVNVIWVLREGGKDNLLTTVDSCRCPRAICMRGSRPRPKSRGRSAGCCWMSMGSMSSSSKPWATGGWVPQKSDSL
jgi:NADPH-dependent ferric siderophore reductase